MTFDEYAHQIKGRGRVLPVFPYYVAFDVYAETLIHGMASSAWTASDYDQNGIRRGCSNLCVL